MQATNEQAAGSDQHIDFAVTFLEGMIDKAIAFIPSVIGALVVLILQDLKVCLPPFSY